MYPGKFETWKNRYLQAESNLFGLRSQKVYALTVARRSRFHDQGTWIAWYFFLLVYEDNWR